MAERRDARAAEDEAQSLQKWSAPSGGETYTEIMAISDKTEFVTRSRMVRDRIVDFAFVHRALVSGVWVNISRIDCQHFEVHRHGPRYVARDTQERKVLAPISGQVTVEEYFYKRLDFADNFEEDEEAWHDTRRSTGTKTYPAHEEFD